MIQHADQMAADYERVFGEPIAVSYTHLDAAQDLFDFVYGMDEAAQPAA